MRKNFAILAALAIACAAIPAQAAPERRQPDDHGGVLYLSLAPELAYNDTTTFRGLSALPSPEQAIVSLGPSPKPRIAYVLAAFPPEANPELSVVSFGIRYTPGIRIVRYGITPEAFQMATRDWPLRGEGMMLGWINGRADTTAVIEVGWLAILAEEAGRVDLVPHPDPQMAGRFVAANPPEMAPIAALGSLGFGEPGFAPEPSFPGPDLGAACIYDSVCVMLTRAEGDYYRTGGAVFLGEGVVCGAAGFCLPDAPRGACCLPDGACKEVTRKECARSGGTYLADETRCQPSPCGGIKSTQDGKGVR